MIMSIHNSNILMPEQFDFSAKQSIRNQLHRVVAFLMKSFNPKKPVAVIFLDIAKDFDKVCLEGFIYQLIQTNIHSVNIFHRLLPWRSYFLHPR